MAAESPAPRGSFGRAALARQSLETDAKDQGVDDEVKSQGLDADVSHHLLVNELRLAEAAAAASAPSAAAPPHTASAVDAANAAAAAMEAAVPAAPPSSPSASPDLVRVRIRPHRALAHPRSGQPSTLYSASIAAATGSTFSGGALSGTLPPAAFGAAGCSICVWVLLCGICGWARVSGALLTNASELEPCSTSRLLSL